jgi:hypothetical protein
MSTASLAAWTLAQEGRALLARLARVKPFALQETMLPAAAPTDEAQTALERHLGKLRRNMRRQIERYLSWLEQGPGVRADAQEAQRRFSVLRLEFNRVLSHVDIFSEALSQRSESESGLWLCGLDVVARDALALPGYFTPPPVICYLARGPGAAIRRARARLPGGGENPVAIIRMPRERMIGSGLASSLIHEVGHQGAALLDLVPSLRRSLATVQVRGAPYVTAWSLWSRWISEILADFWAVAKVGITSTQGLIGVVSLPRPFVFRANFDDPHPMPWMRVKLSAAIGQALYPDAQWSRLSALWESFYPLDGLLEEQRSLIDALLHTMPAFVEHLVQHRPARLLRHTLANVLSSSAREPEQLRHWYRQWRRQPALIRIAAPSLVFAVIGQARSDGAIDPQTESDVLEKALRFWALQTSLDARAASGALGRTRHDSWSPAAIYPAHAVY